MTEVDFPKLVLSSSVCFSAPWVPPFPSLSKPTSKRNSIQEVWLIFLLNKWSLDILAMIFDEIPSELKQLIFTYFTPNDWINTAKVSREWRTLTLACFEKIESCHLLILDHLAEFYNPQETTNYTWVSLLALLTKLRYLECSENTVAFWTELRQVCHQLKILNVKPRNPTSFDWNTVDISFENLVELLWDGTIEEIVFPLKWLSLCPKLEKLKLRNVRINAEWQGKIPKSVQHVLLDIVIFDGKDQCYPNYFCEDASALETFSAKQVTLPPQDGEKDLSTDLFDVTPRLKNLELDFVYNNAPTSDIFKNALAKCQILETVKATNLIVTETWQSSFPANVKSMDLSEMKVEENIRHDFSPVWLFQDYDCLQSLELRNVDWSGFASQKFYSTQNLKKLYVDNYASFPITEGGTPVILFSNICLRMIQGSHLVDVEICKVTIYLSWEHIFPSTIRRLKLKDFVFSLDSQKYFSPQFICENPSNIEKLTFSNFHGKLDAMNLNAFTGMQMLQELNLDGLRLSGACLQSILTHCSALTDLLIEELTADSLTKIPIDLVLPSVLKLNVKKAVDKPALLLQYFPKVRTVDIAIVPSEASFSAIMNALQEAESVQIKLSLIPWDRFRSLIESMDDTNFYLSYVTNESHELNFHWTKSLLNACRKLDDVGVSGVNCDVLWIRNYPNLPMLRQHGSNIPSTIDELSHRYMELT